MSVPSTSAGDVELRVRIVGNLNLAAAVTTRQVINGLLARVHRIGYGVQSKNCRKFSVCFQTTTVARVVPSVDISGALEELRIILVTDAPTNTKDSSPALGNIRETRADSHTCNPASSHSPEQWHPVSVSNNGVSRAQSISCFGNYAYSLVVSCWLVNLAVLSFEQITS